MVPHAVPASARFAALSLTKQHGASAAASSFIGLRIVGQGGGTFLVGLGAPVLFAGAAVLCVVGASVVWYVPADLPRT